MLITAGAFAAGAVGACRGQSSPPSTTADARRPGRAGPTAATPAARRTPPPFVPWSMDGPCLRRLAKVGKRSLKAQRVIHVDRRSPRWLVLARQHIARAGGCAGCGNVGRTWKPRTVGFHAHLGAGGQLLVEGHAVAPAALTPAVQSCFNLLDSEGMQVLLTVAPNQRRSAVLTAVLRRLLLPGVSVHLYAR